MLVSNWKSKKKMLVSYWKSKKNGLLVTGKVTKMTC